MCVCVRARLCTCVYIHMRACVHACTHTHIGTVTTAAGTNLPFTITLSLDCMVTVKLGSTVCRVRMREFQSVCGAEHKHIGADAHRAGHGATRPCTRTYSTGPTRRQPVRHLERLGRVCCDGLEQDGAARGLQPDGRHWRARARAPGTETLRMVSLLWTARTRAAARRRVPAQRRRTDVHDDAGCHACAVHELRARAVLFVGAVRGIFSFFVFFPRLGITEGTMHI